MSQKDILQWINWPQDYWITDLQPHIQMSQKKIKSENKHTVKEVLKSLEWGIEDNKLTLLCPITDEYITIELSEVKKHING